MVFLEEIEILADEIKRRFRRRLSLNIIDIL